MDNREVWIFSILFYSSGALSFRNAIIHHRDLDGIPGNSSDIIKLCFWNCKYLLFLSIFKSSKAKFSIHSIISWCHPKPTSFYEIQQQIEILIIGFKFNCSSFQTVIFLVILIVIVFQFSIVNLLIRVMSLYWNFKLDECQLSWLSFMSFNVVSDLALKPNKDNHHEQSYYCF